MSNNETLVNVPGMVFFAMTIVLEPTLTQNVPMVAPIVHASEHTARLDAEYQTTADSPALERAVAEQIVRHVERPMSRDALAGLFGDLTEPSERQSKPLK